MSEIQHILGIDMAIEERKVSFNYLNEADFLQRTKNLESLGYPSVKDSNSMVLK